MVTRNVNIPQKEIAAFCHRYYIKKMSLFGSVLRTDFSPDSDLDILVEFEPGKTPGFFRISAMEDELSTLFSGRKIDLRTPADLSRYFRDRVIEEADVICQ